MLNTANLLILLPTIPLFGAIGCFCLHRQRALAVYLAETLMLVTLALGTIVTWDYSRQAPALAAGERGKDQSFTAIDIPMGRLAERGPVVSLTLAIDGLNTWLVFLTLVVGTTVVAAGSGWTGEKAGSAMGLILLLVSLTILAFMSMDMLVFYVFFELTLVPVFLLIGVWGGSDRVVASQRMFLHTLAGGLCTLLGLLTVAGATGSFAWDSLNANRPGASQIAIDPALIFLLLMAGFVVKTPLVPFHTWQAITYREAPIPITVFLSAVMAKLGLYGMLRLGVYVLPGEMESVGAPVLGGMAVASIVVGALCAFGARDLKTLLAYSSLSHLGYVVLGIVSLDQAGEQGAIFHMVAHGIVTTGLLMAAGFIEEAEGTLERSRLNGLLEKYPVLSGLFVFFSLASVGVPGLSQFVGEFLCLFGFFRSGVASWLGIAAIAGVMSGLFLGAWYTMTLIQVSFSGESVAGSVPVPARPRQVAILGSIAVLVVWMGMAPGLILETSRPEINKLETRLQSLSAADARHQAVLAGLDRAKPE